MDTTLSLPELAANYVDAQYPALDNLLKKTKSFAIAELCKFCEAEQLTRWNPSNQLSVRENIAQFRAAVIDQYVDFNSSAYAELTRDTLDAPVIDAPTEHAEVVMTCLTSDEYLDLLLGQLIDAKAVRDVSQCKKIRAKLRAHGYHLSSVRH